MSSVLSDQAVADSQNASLEPSLLHRLLKKCSALDSYRSALLPSMRQSSLLWIAKLWHYSFLPIFLLCLYQVSCLSQNCYFKGIMTFNLVADIPCSTHRKAWQPLRHRKAVPAILTLHPPVRRCSTPVHTGLTSVHLNRSGIWASTRSRFKKPKVSVYWLPHYVNPDMLKSQHWDITILFENTIQNKNERKMGTTTKCRWTLATSLFCVSLLNRSWK